IPDLKEAGDKVEYGISKTETELDNHPCTKRVDLEADEKELIKDLNAIILATQMHHCGSYCQRKSKYSQKPSGHPHEHETHGVVLMKKNVY
ncbi:MAG: hypothetical protein RIR48_1594, partial [Bacteroidota bacterium]